MTTKIDNIKILHLIKFLSSLYFYPPYFVKANVSGYLFGFTLAVASLLGVFTSRYAYLFEKVFGVKKGVLLAVLLPGLFYFLLAFIFHSIISILLVFLLLDQCIFKNPYFQII